MTNYRIERHRTIWDHIGLYRSWTEHLYLEIAGLVGRLGSVPRLVGRLGRKVIDCVCVIKTQIFMRCEWSSLGPVRSFRSRAAQFRSDVLRCGPMRSDAVISHRAYPFSRDVTTVANIVTTRATKTKPRWLLPWRDQ